MSLRSQFQKYRDLGADFPEDKGVQQFVRSKKEIIYANRNNTWIVIGASIAALVFVLSVQKCKQEPIYRMPDAARIDRIW